MPTRMPTKQECDKVAQELLDMMADKVGKWPAELAVSVMLGASTALAVACRKDRKKIHGMVDQACDDIGIE